ncbi:MobF family relaxase [Acidocella aminolytica]|uniref:AAA+ ATPase domain-containing protein n=1 Tax=Acidocella aminolytica 101 = DSM 11237 TaxID=1120923 RepID=A0A0D6PJ85_9PROT|nr:MobF family relaxase [Acidocella aminolytica]GAN81456.1 hypothetical protein Aam_096_015 [Acidocella aminolytica 101 = DSM 11237]GBQ35072.1 conjugative relaxase domain-containing protein [Acidocella aminolytica 101 = DSM 11237]SHF01957.1 conjugative relaxase domain-containing protein, TrwC/TraI family [Acidocella aminolytica 101 = DSM 11237]
MLKVTPLSSIEYLTDSTQKAGQTLAYYTDSNEEPPGQIWCPGSWILEDGSTAEAIAVKRMAQGRHPVTGRRIVTGRGDKHRAGCDLTFSAPKPWTALWTVSDAPQRARLDKMLMASVREALGEILGRGLLEARTGKGGKKRESMSGLVAALYRHRTSREGDPQAHIHAALLNIGQRADGSIRAINNEKLCEVHKAMGALFRLKLAERLELCGVAVESDRDHNFILKGQPAELADRWSKRRKQILKAAKKTGLPHTAGHLKAIDALALKTRGSKDDLPSFRLLDELWQKEALEIGVQQNDLWCQLDRTPVSRTAQESKANGVDVVQQAIANLLLNQSIFKETEIEAEALSLAVGKCTATEVSIELQRVMQSEEIIYLKYDGLMTTQAVIDQEQEVIAVAKRRQNDLSVGFSQPALAAALSNDKFSDEQRTAILHALAANGVAVVEGGPGVGKTTSASGLQTACACDKRCLILVAPSWTAAETLKRELNHDGLCLALDKLLSDLRKGKLALQASDVILMDEAGMSSTAQMLELLQRVNAAGAKLVLQGDSNQIASVSRGDPLALLSDAIGSQQIRYIRRQRHDWQRKASMKAQDGEIADALHEYATRGDIRVGDDRDAVLGQMVEAYKRAHGDAVGLAATNDQVTALNAVFRQVARGIGLVHGPDLTIKAFPRGRKKGSKPVELKLAVGDKLILGAEAHVGGIVLRNASRIVVENIDHESRYLTLYLEDGREVSCSADALMNSGVKGKPIVMQHAYAVTAHAAQGATWERTLWFASKEDRRSALVAMTRHRESLEVFIDKSSVPRFEDSVLNVSKHAMEDPVQAEDMRSDTAIATIVGKSMERVTRPRNALDVLTPAVAIARPKLNREFARKLVPETSKLPNTGESQVRVPPYAEFARKENYPGEVGSQGRGGLKTSAELNAYAPAPVIDSSTATPASDELPGPSM